MSILVFRSFIVLYMIHCAALKKERSILSTNTNQEQLYRLDRVSSPQFFRNEAKLILLPPVQPTCSIIRMSTLTDDQKQSFMKNGYLIIPQGVSEELVNGALKVTDDAVKDGQVNKKEGPQGSTHPQLGFWQNIRSHSAVMALLYESGLFQIAEQLMGEGNVAIMGDNSQVAYVYQADIHVKEGMDSKKSLKKWCWHVDKPFGDYQAKGADFVLLIGVALSEGQEVDENRGQLTVWPGKTFILVSDDSFIHTIVSTNENLLQI